MAEEVAVRSDSKPVWKWIRRAVKFALTAGLIAVIADKIDWRDWKLEFNDVRAGMVLTALMLAAVNLWIQYKKWQYLVHILNPDISASNIWASLVCGFSVGLVTPGRIGELGKGLFISSIPKTQATGMSLLDKLFSQLALGIFGLIGLGYFILRDVSFPPAVVISCAILAVLLVLVGLAVVTKPAWIRSILRKMPRFASGLPFGNKIESVLITTEHFKRANFLPSVSYGLAFQLTIYLQTALCVASFHDIDWTSAMAASAAAMFVKSLLPIAIMDIGVRESSMMYFFGLLLIPSAAALNGSLLLFLINVLLPGIIGLPYVWRVKHTSV